MNIMHKLLLKSPLAASIFLQFQSSTFRVAEQWTTANLQPPFTNNSSKRRLFKNGTPVIKQGQLN